MVVFLVRLDRIPLDWKLTHETLFHDFLHFNFKELSTIWIIFGRSKKQYPYLEIFRAIRFAIFLEKFSINPFFANATFKALFVIDLAKSCAAFDSDWPSASTAGSLRIFTSYVTGQNKMRKKVLYLTNTLFNCLCHAISNFGKNFRIL